MGVTIQPRTGCEIDAKELGLIPRRYKRTTAGVIPEDWTVARIGDIASIKTGTKNTQDKQVDGEYPFFVRSQEIERINSYSYDGEAVLTAGDGVGTGKVFHYVNGRFDVHQRVYRIVDFCDAVDGRYFFYQFSTRFYNRVMSMTAKSSVDSVRLEMISDMRIPMPTLREQRAIAKALSDVDESLSALDDLIAKKQDIRHGTIQQLLTGSTRLPGFAGKWHIKSMSHLAQMDPESLGSNTPPAFTFNYISLEQVDAGSLIGYSALEFGSAPSRARRIVRPGDVLMSAVRPNLKGHLLFSGQVPNAVCSTGFVVLRAKDGLCDPGFLFSHLMGPVVGNQVEKALVGSNYPALNSRDVELISIPCPPTIQEQHAIAEVLSDMGAEISALFRRRDKTRAIKQGMMQELLTGRTRLL